MDFKKLGRRIGLEEFEFKEIVRLFIESSTSDMKEFDSALRDGDARKASAAIHSIKGAALNLGFHHISRAAVDIENQARQNSFAGLSGAAARLKMKIERIAEHVD